MSVAAADMKDEMGWSDNDKGLVLSAFYWGYTVGQIPASWLIQKYGAKWIFGFSVLVPSILTLFVPMACRSSFAVALILRCIIGFTESASFPAVYHFFPIWVPLEEKTLMIPFIASGMYMGEIVGFPMSGVLCGSDINIGGYSYGGWSSVFYIFGLAGILWFPFWALRAYESPDDHPHISKEEVMWIKKGKIFTTVKDLQHEQEINGVEAANFEATNPLRPQIENTTDANTTINANQQKKYKGKSVSIEYNEEETFEHSLLGNDEDLTVLHTTNELNFAVDTHLHSGLQHHAEGHHGHGHHASRVVSVVTDVDDDIPHRIPYYHFFTHPVSLTLFMNNWTFGFIGFTLLSEMPSYFNDELGFDVVSSGWLCAMPYLALFLSAIAFGAMFEQLQNIHGWKTDTIRQVAEYLAFAGSGIGLIICGFMEDKYLAYAFMIFTQFMMGASQSGLACAYSDVAPNFSSALNSIGNSIGAAAGIVGPLMVAAFTEKYEGAWGWRLSFFVTNIFVVLSLISWSVYQTSKAVPELNTPAPRY